MRALAMLLLVGACLDNPNVNGSTVPPITNADASCVDICARIVQLCKLSPNGNNCTNADASGYCDTVLSGNLACIGQATSCEQVWSTADSGCSYVPPAMVDAGADAPDVGAGDAASE
jgi:hypothetical protein